LACYFEFREWDSSWPTRPSCSSLSAATLNNKIIASPFSSLQDCSLWELGFSTLCFLEESRHCTYTLWVTFFFAFPSIYNPAQLWTPWVSMSSKYLANGQYLTFRHSNSSQLHQTMAQNPKTWCRHIFFSPSLSHIDICFLPCSPPTLVCKECYIWRRVYIWQPSIYII
jgi:hypothetical protein